MQLSQETKAHTHPFPSLHTTLVVGVRVGGGGMKGVQGGEERGRRELGAFVNSHRETRGGPLPLP